MKDFSLFIKSLKTLISFKSTKGEPKDNMPFGEECDKALNYFLSLASSFGFETINYDGYAGEVSFGEGEEIGIIGHLDVVPTGIGWVTDPFTLTKKDEVYFGRGVIDDKAGTLMCLFALKELKESNIIPNRKFRLFAGINEESGWKDVDYLKTKTTLPEYGFSPDANFPLSYAEKGITIVDFSIPKFKNFYSIKGGTAINAVCDYACCRATDNGINLSLLKKHQLVLSDNNLIESFGKAAHGSTPHLGKNAIKPLLQYFIDMGEEVDEVVCYLFDDKAGLSNVMTEQGKVTLSPDLIKEENEKVIISCDCRIPAPLQKSDLLGFFDSFNIPYNATEKHPSVMVEKDGWLVDCLLSAYKEITGDNNASPKAIGGSTFARAFNKGCAFGPSFDGNKGNYHDANEYIEEKEMLDAYKIYKKAIFNLAKK